MLTFFVVVFAAIVFEYSNGFHDAANAIATVVSTKVLTSRQAIVMAAIFNLTGALLGGAVASTIGKGLVDTNFVTMATVLCALIAAFAWNITTWWVGLASSSSHALIGGRGNWSVIEVEQRAVAEGGCSDDYIAAGWFFPRRSGHVRAFSDLSSFYAGGSPFCFRQVANF
jgi:phosphate/sulfate permease